MKKLYVGIDLGIKDRHRASVYDPQENRYLDNSFAFSIDFQGFEYMLERVQQHVSEGEEVQLNFVMEPTSLAWMPLSCYLVSRGHKVYRVTPQQSSDFREFQSKYVKTDRIDSRALAKLPLVSEEAVYEVYLPSSDLGALSRWARYLAKITQQATSRKLRIQSLFSMINPRVLAALGDNRFSQAGRTLYRHFVDPFKIVNLGLEGFSKAFRSLCSWPVAERVLERIYEVSISTTRIYEGMKRQGGLPFDFAQLEDEVRIELDLLEDEEKKIRRIELVVAALYQQIDPERYLMSPQGIGKAVAPAILGIIGDVSRFPSIDAFRGYFGFVPKKNQSSSREMKGLRIRKAAQSLLKKYMFLAAETARRYDPEFAAAYDRVTKRGLHHYQAVCALANKMAGRVYALLKRMQRAENSRYRSSAVSVEPAKVLKPEEVVYKLRDLEGNIVNKKTARQLIMTKFPSALQKRKDEKSRRNSKESATNREACMKNQKSRESSASQKSFTDQPGQFAANLQTNSSMRNGRTLPAGSLLEDMLSKLSLQVELRSNSQETGDLDRLVEEKVRADTVVDNLWIGGGKETSKKT